MHFYVKLWRFLGQSKQHAVELIAVMTVDQSPFISVGVVGIYNQD